jgi:hypothetical protein
MNDICCEKFSFVTEFKTVFCSPVVMQGAAVLQPVFASMNSLQRLEINSELSGGICIDKHGSWCSSLFSGCQRPKVVYALGRFLY